MHCSFIPIARAATFWPCLPHIYKYVQRLWLNLFYLLAVSQSIFTFTKNEEGPIFFSCAGAAEQVRCGLRALTRSPVSSGGAFYILHLHHQGNDTDLSGTDLNLYLISFSYLLSFLSSFLSLSHSYHQHLYTDIPSSKKSFQCSTRAQTLF